MLALITQGAGFGFAAATSPGPLLTFLINTTLSLGWRQGIMVIFAPLISDAPIILVMTFLLGQVPDAFIRVLQIVGGLYVIWLAWLSWQTLRRNPSLGVQRVSMDRSQARRKLFQAVGMNYLSPGPYIFWGFVTGPILQTALQESAALGVIFLLSFYLTFLGVMVIWVFVFDRLRRVNETLTRGAQMVSVVVLALLGLQLIIQGIQG